MQGYRRASRARGAGERVRARARAGEASQHEARCGLSAFGTHRARRSCGAARPRLRGPDPPAAAGDGAGAASGSVGEGRGRGGAREGGGPSLGLHCVITASIGGGSDVPNTRARRLLTLPLGLGSGRLSIPDSRAARRVAETDKCVRGNRGQGRLVISVRIAHRLPPPFLPSPLLQRAALLARSFAATLAGAAAPPRRRAAGERRARARWPSVRRRSAPPPFSLRQFVRRSRCCRWRRPVATAAAAAALR